MKLKINQLKANESNPRIIKEAKFKKLVQSVKDFPEMLDLRPIIIDEDNIILFASRSKRLEPVYLRILNQLKLK